MKTKKMNIAFIKAIFCFLLLSCQKQIIINIAPPENISYAISTITGFSNVADSSIAPSIKWNNEIGSFLITSGLRTGIYINQTTGKINWNKYLLPGSYPIKVKALNSAGASAETNLILEILGTPPSSLQYSKDSMLITHQINEGVQYSVAPSVQWRGTKGIFKIMTTKILGINIDSINGVISCTNNITRGIYTLTIQAQNKVGFSEETFFKITVGSAPAVMFYKPDSLICQYGIGASSPLPILLIQGGLTLKYSFNINPTAGISIDSTTGIISTPNTLVTGTYSVYAQAANALGITTSSVLKIKVTPAVSNTLSYDTTKFSVSNGDEIKISPTTTIGLTNINYSLNEQPEGLSIDANTGVISTGSFASEGTFPFKVIATNSITGFTTSASYNVNVKTALQHSVSNIYRVSTNVLLSKTDSIKAGDELKITGTGFSNDESKILIKINGDTVGFNPKPEGLTKTALYFKLPNDVIGGYDADNTKIIVTIKQIDVPLLNPPKVYFGIDASAISKLYLPGTSTAFSNEAIDISGYGFSNTAADWMVIVFDGNVLPVSIIPSSATPNKLTFAAPNQYGAGRVSVVHVATNIKKWNSESIHIPAFDSMILVELYNTMGGSSWATQNRWNTTEQLSASPLSTSTSISSTYVTTGWGGIVLQAFNGTGTSSPFNGAGITTTSGSGVSTHKGHPESNGTYRVSRIYSSPTNYASSGKNGTNGWKGQLPASIGGTVPVAGFINTITTMPINIASTYVYKGGLTRLSHFYANGQNLYGTLPNSLANLAYIGTLNINGNLLTGSLPEGLGTNNNTAQIGGTLNYSIGTSTNLSLHSNNFTGLLPASILAYTLTIKAGWMNGSVSGSNITIPNTTTGGICAQTKKVNGSAPDFTGTTSASYVSSAWSGTGGAGFDVQTGGCPEKWWP